MKSELYRDYITLFFAVIVFIALIKKIGSQKIKMSRTEISTSYVGICVCFLTAVSETITICNPRFISAQNTNVVFYALVGVLFVLLVLVVKLAKEKLTKSVASTSEQRIQKAAIALTIVCGISFFCLIVWLVFL